MEPTNVTECPTLLAKVARILLMPHQPSTVFEFQYSQTYKAVLFKLLHKLRPVFTCLKCIYHVIIVAPIVECTVSSQQADSQTSKCACVCVCVCVCVCGGGV